MQELKDFVWMANAAGSRIDYVQAGGGNTSVKFSDDYMAIKASGYLLKDITETRGFVAVNGKELREYHYAPHEEGVDCNQQAIDISMASIKQINGEPAARPSIEVGFHSVLNRFVLHLHPVYSNILACSKGGVQKLLNIAGDAGIRAASVAYAMPGFSLTKLIIDAVESYKAQNGQDPEIIFLKNHGVVAQASQAEEALRLMEAVNDAVISALKLPAFPVTGLQKTETGYKSGCDWMKRVLFETEIARDIRYSPIYPDQLVYTTGELSIDGSGSGKIALKDGEVYYNAGEKEATALEETMVALVYVYHNIKALGLEFEVLNQEECEKILGWGSEKYRKSMMSGT